MKISLLFILLIAVVTACSKPKNQVAEEKHPLESVDTMDFTGNWVAKDTFSIYHYLDTIAYYGQDSSYVIQLAQKDADKGAYFFMSFGLSAFPDMDEKVYEKTRLKQQKLCTQYNIWIFDMGCENSEVGNIYTREMKKHLKKNKGIDFDSVFSPALVTL